MIWLMSPHFHNQTNILMQMINRIKLSLVLFKHLMDPAETSQRMRSYDVAREAGMLL